MVLEIDSLYLKLTKSPPPLALFLILFGQVFSPKNFSDGLERHLPKRAKIYQSRVFTSYILTSRLGKRLWITLASTQSHSSDIRLRLPQLHNKGGMSASELIIQT